MWSPNYNPQYNPNEVNVTHCKLASGTKIWHLSIVEHVDHADVVLADVQMCLVQFRSCDHAMQMATHVVKIKMADEMNLSFFQFITQLLLEYNGCMSPKQF